MQPGFKCVEEPNIWKNLRDLYDHHQTTHFQLNPCYAVWMIYNPIQYPETSHALLSTFSYHWSLYLPKNLPVYEEERC